MTKTQGIRLGLFTIVLGMILLVIISLFGIPVEGDTLSIAKRFNEFYDEPENTWDCVMVGTSSVDRQWVAPLAWHDYGMTVYAMNTDVQPLMLTSNILDEVRKRQNVKLAIVDIRGIRDESFAPSETKIRRVTDNMKLSENKLKTIQKAISFYKEYYSREDVEDGEKFLKILDEPSLYFSFLKYHSRWKTGLTKDDFIRPVSDMKGVYQDEDFCYTISERTPTTPITDSVELNELQKKALDEIVDYGESTGLEILFIFSPSQVRNKEQPEINAAINYLGEKGIEVLNFNTEEMYKEVGIDFNQDLYNAHHLNVNGALKFTKYFSKYLHDNYQFEDKRGQDEYQDWDEAYDNYMEFYTNSRGKMHKK